MAKNRQSDTRKFNRHFNDNSQSNNRKITKGRRKQIIWSEPRKIFVERYITDHMLEKAIRLGLSKKEALDKYGKNRYKINLNAKPVKTIPHD